ncbi:hypothetical protein [Mycobacterium canetti]|uniref:hypothetical protein n=1 Tax=Mycobacterium canetti TaxID=78331 RepID=UPI0002A592D4|nr:hypothetical protein [Mycobacterium canetti]CCK62874.1 Protein of unknown function [Mycobacterium canettii CIPT 140070017]
MGSVTVTAKHLLAEAVKNSGRKTSVQLPSEFARIQLPTDTATPLSTMFAQGEVTLKLYITLVLLTRKPPHELYKVFPDHYWAEMLGYEELNDADPIPGAGTKRIKRAMAVLQTGGPCGNGWISRTREPGKGYSITVTHLEQTYAPWIGIPLELWSRGWINVMSARALFVYLCLRLVLAGNNNDQSGAHVSSADRKRFAIKDDTWQRGMKELEKLKLARSEIGKSTANRWSTDLRTHKIYYLNNGYLTDNDSPLEPVELP